MQRSHVEREPDHGEIGQRRHGSRQRGSEARRLEVTTFDDDGAFTGYRV